MHHFPVGCGPRNLRPVRHATDRSGAVPSGIPSSGGDNGDGEGRQLSFALIWSFVLTFGDQAITLIVTFLLARQLGPEVFGLAALAIVYVLFVELVLKQGLTAALIHRRDVSPVVLDTAFWMILAFTFLLSALTIALAGVWADVNKEPELRDLTLVLAFMVPIRGLIVVQDSLLRRGLDFRALTARHLTSATVAGVVALVLAYNGAGVWALIVQQLVLAGVDLVMLWGIVEWRPGRRWSSPVARELLAYALPSSAATLGVFASERSDTVVTSIYFGSVAVGLHRFALRFVDVLVAMFSGPFIQVSLPELSRLQHDRPAFAARITDLMHMSALLAFPVFAGLAAGGRDLLELAGDDWLPAADALKILCLAGAFRSLNFYNAPVLQALGRTGFLATVEWGQAILKIGVIVAVAASLRDELIVDQISGLAASIAGLEAFYLFGIAVPILIRVGGTTGRGIFEILRIPVPAATSGFVLVELLRRSGAIDDVPAFVRMALTGGLALVIAVGLEIALDRRLREEVTDRVLAVRS